MTINEVRQCDYWIDGFGNIWKRLYFCMEPTVTLQCITKEDVKNIQKSGAIGCLLFEDFKPLMTKEEYDNLNTNR